MTTLSRTATLALALTLAPALAFAKGGTPQNHHCMKDGAELTGKTRKECKKEGGTWDKMSGEAAKGEAPKAEAPKAAAPKTEAPKTEAPKAEAPKPAK